MSRKQTSEQPKIQIKNVYKIFGPDPQAALERAKQGASKTELLEESGHTIGIRDISLDMPAGETFVVMGLSGSGKSTLIRHINRLIEPTAGQILVDGDDVLQLDEQQLLDLRRRRMSMVFQRFALLPHKSVIDNVAYGLTVQGVERAEARERAVKQIELVGLAGFENQFPRQLSGGMQQRVGLARALATDAEILLMDEAFSALDPLIRTDMQDQLRELQATLHKTIVFITHDLDEALRLGDHIAILKDGELRQVGSPEEILLHPADDYVERFVRDVNRGRVVTVGSIVEHIPTLRLPELDPQKASAQLDQADGDTLLILDDDSRPVGAISRRFLEANAGRSASWWQDSSNLDEVHTVTRDSVIDEMLPYVSGSDTPAVVVDDEGQLVGVVTRSGAIDALAKVPEPEPGEPAGEQQERASA